MCVCRLDHRFQLGGVAPAGTSVCDGVVGGNAGGGLEVWNQEPGSFSSQLAELRPQGCFPEVAGSMPDTSGDDGVASLPCSSGDAPERSVSTLRCSPLSPPTWLDAVRAGGGRHPTEMDAEDNLLLRFWSFCCCR